MARLKSQETIREYDFETLRLEITETAKGGRRIVGYLKSNRTGLPTDTMLFDDEEELGSLADDVAEAMQIVTAEEDKDAQTLPNASAMPLRLSSVTASVLSCPEECQTTTSDEPRVSPKKRRIA